MSLKDFHLDGTLDAPRGPTSGCCGGRVGLRNWKETGLCFRHGLRHSELGNHLGELLSGAPGRSCAKKEPPAPLVVKSACCSPESLTQWL